MKPTINLIIFVLIFPLIIKALDLTEQEKVFVKNNSRVKIALMPDFSPFSFIKDDKVVGFENDLLKILSKKTGLLFEKQYDIWNKILKRFKNKKVDMISSISYKKEREIFTNFTTPYYKIPIMIFIRDNFGKYEGLKSLEGKKVGILKDVFYTKDIKKHTKIELKIYENYEDLTQALVFGKIDALFQNLPNINYLIKKNLYSNLVLAEELKLPGIEKEDLRFGINPEKPLLHSIIQKALDNIEENEWTAITDKWLSVKSISKKSEKEKKELLTAEEKEYLEKNIIQLGLTNDYYPFSYKENDRISGFSYEYLKLLASKVNMNYEVQIDDWALTLDKFKNKKIQIIDAISYTKERDKFTNFTDAYFEIPNVIFSRTGSFEDYKGIQSLKGKKVGITQEIYYYNTIKNLNLFKLVPFKSSRKKFKALALGKIDLAFNSITSGQKYVIQGGYSNIKIIDEISDKIIKKEDLRLGVGKDNLILYSIIKKAMNSVSENERMQLNNKYFGFGYEKKYTNNELTLNLTPKEQDYLAEKKELRMSVLPNSMPFEQIDKNGNHVGVAADIIKLISKRIDKPIILVPTENWSKSLENIKDRKVDILPFAMRTPDRQEYMNFTDPFIDDALVVATKTDKFFIKNISELKNHKIGIVNSYAFIQVIKQKNPDIQIVKVKNIKEGLKKVQKGELYGYVDALPLIAYAIQKEGMLDLKIAGKLDYDIKISIASRSDEPLLNNILNKALADIGEEQIRTIIGNWISIKVQQEFDYRKLIYISVFFVTILLILTYKNESIKKLNNKIEEKNQRLQKKKNSLEESYKNLQKTQDEIVKLERKNSILAMIVTTNHEINQPLTSALGNLQLLKIKLEKSKIEDKSLYNKHIVNIHKSLNTISHILKKYRDNDQYDISDYTNGIKMVDFKE